MSGHELPPDLNDWPHDPYRLLGVGFGVAPRELKRAYLHLIRRYKPEHHPDHFRQIRQAYETILNHLKIWNPAGSSPPRDEPGPAGRDEAGPGEEPPEEPAREPRPVPATPDDFWELACQGKEADAYRELRALQERDPECPDTYPRLYWLLVVRPELDPDRPAQDWLARGLRTDPWSSRLRELYRREIDADPAEALTPRVARLLRQGGSSGLDLDVASWRWRSAQRLGRGEVIVDDVKVLRGAGRAADESAWIRLLVSAAMHLAWSDGFLRDGVTSYCAEIERLSHLHTELDDELVRLDYILAVSEGWIALKREPETPDSLTRLLPRSWDARGPEVGPLLGSFLGGVARAPGKSLGLFDRIHQGAPAVLGHLAELFDGYRDEVVLVPDPRSPDDLAPPILAFLSASEWWDYARFRPRLLTFCLREAIAPADLAAVARGQPGLAAADPHLAANVEADWPLRHVYTACELFWG